MKKKLLIMFAAICAIQKLIAQSPETRPEDDPIVKISSEIIRVSDSHVEVANALFEAHNKPKGAERYVTSLLKDAAEQFNLCVTDLGIYLVEAKFQAEAKVRGKCDCPPLSVNSWAERARKHLEVTDKRLDVFYGYGDIIPSDVMKEARSLQRDVEKAIEFCRRVDLEFKGDE